MKNLSIYIILPVLCLITGYYLALVSLIWGNLKKESIYLSLVCFWWTILSYAFIYHQFETSPEKVMLVERAIHTVYVFAPVISLLFFQSSIGKINKAIISTCTLLSTALAFTVHTPYYFHGFYYYKWGMIAKGGIAFKIFSIYGIVYYIYIIVVCIKKIRPEKNYFVRLKYYYLFLAYFLSAGLIFTNIPAMNGIDFYPLSNLMFIPLWILAYGIIKYKFVRISGVLPRFIFWVVFSSLIVAPNLFIFILIKHNFYRLNTPGLMVVFILWYFPNFFYAIKIQPLINQLFDRRNYNLSLMEKAFIDDIAMLKNLDELVHMMLSMLKKALYIEHAGLYLRWGYSGSFADYRGNILQTDLKAEQVLLSGTFFEKSLLESEFTINNSAGELLSLFSKSDSEYIVPLIHQSELIAILTLKKKENRSPLLTNEIAFICNLSSYATIALANSVMYQNLSDLKDNLEKIVEERTAIIESQKTEMESDIKLARKIQMSLLPAKIPELKNLQVAFKYEPIMGVGGDFIDIHCREGMDEFGIFICDVSGHGASSAMIAAMVKMTLNSWGRFIRQPGKALIEIRDLLKGKIGDNFITAYMCCIDMKLGVITSACAGHPPMALIRHTGDIELVKPAGKVLFELAGSDYEEISIALNDGDKIVLYTDGVFETRDQSGSIIGEERFFRMLQENSRLSAGDLCDKIYNEIFVPPGNITDDDFALLVAEYKG